MEEDWYADRIRLRQLLQAHPDWSHRARAAEIGRSVGWVKKWTKRLRAALDDDQLPRDRVPRVWPAVECGGGGGSAQRAVGPAGPDAGASRVELCRLSERPHSAPVTPQTNPRSSGTESLPIFA